MKESLFFFSLSQRKHLPLFVSTVSKLYLSPKRDNLLTFRTFFAQKKRRGYYFSILPQNGTTATLGIATRANDETRVVRVVFIVSGTPDARNSRRGKGGCGRARIYFFYHLFFRQKGKRYRPYFCVTGRHRICKDGLVHHTGRIATETVERQAREEQGRAKVNEEERNRLARFALEDDSEGDFSSVSFNKGGEGC